MQPVLIAPETERGYYVVWNANTWERQRVSFVRLFLLWSLSGGRILPLTCIAEGVGSSLLGP